MKKNMTCFLTLMFAASLIAIPAAARPHHDTGQVKSVKLDKDNDKGKGTDHSKKDDGKCGSTVTTGTTTTSGTSGSSGGSGSTVTTTGTSGSPITTAF
jgi:hypothetical protein